MSPQPQFIIQSAARGIFKDFVTTLLVRLQWLFILILIKPATKKFHLADLQRVTLPFFNGADIGKWPPSWGFHFLVIPGIQEDHVTCSCQENASRIVSLPGQLVK